MYFEKPFNRYKYYMVHTPYDNHNIEFENPSICMSNDGINFIKPKNIKDPLLPIIKRGENKIAKYYSDNFLFYDKNKLQIWYRYTEEDKSCKPFKLKNKIFRITTEDAINYTKPELILSDDEIWYLSPSIAKINDSYYLYYFDKDLKLYTKTSNNLKKWSSPKLVTISNFNNNCWHGEVKLIKNKLYLLLLSKDYKLYFCQTDKSSPTKFNTFNEIHFNYYDKNHIYGNTHPYKSTFLINNGFIDLYIPFTVNIINHFRLKGIRHIKWTMTYTHIKNSTYNKYIKN